LPIEFDNGKNIANVAKHGVDMTAAADFDFETAVTWTDTRRRYGEAHHSHWLHRASTACFGFHHARPKVALISLRKANRKESTSYHGKK
jgi:uncharacterized protein